MFPGNTADPDAFTEIVKAVCTTFRIERLVLVGDRGMITTARIDALRKLGEDLHTAIDYGWISALRAPQIAKLAADDGPLQMTPFDTQDLAEVTHPDYPGERLDWKSPESVEACTMRSSHVRDTQEVRPGVPRGRCGLSGILVSRSPKSLETSGSMRRPG
jgi:hypothetical protein